MSEEKKPFADAQVLESKSGVKYVRINRDLPAGTALFYNAPDAALQNLLKKGEITQQEFESKKSKIPSFILSNLNAAKG